MVYSSFALAKLERRHLNRQAKKDAKFEPLEVVGSVDLDREALRRKSERDYLEANFPLEKNYEGCVRLDS